ncbi:hypothetical protein GYMLUDRAFT_264870 [Collybiopsis luxurians FD-317 M1]|uniref:NmrA-like domain-containing protein n=1 Tax=Collybiopsis luxurians FD-317 M1 TaxID=944289 RepID=A0A0D0C7Z3_9AGAR|nr:hypothetical protein GYMLUDRAFT_264870 [Collybiopsis luxurians FD-317 M1]
MSFSTRSIALVGVGGIGSHILRGFLNAVHCPKLIVLTRAESKSKHLSSNLSSVPTFTIDYTDDTTLATLFRAHAIDVVVSTISESALQAQYTLADAAKASGSVKLFVPSEWGIPTEGAKEAEISNTDSIKDEFAEYLKSIDLPYTRFYTGYGFSYLPWLVGMDVDDKVHIVGRGETEFSATSEADIGGFTAHLLTSLPLDSSLLVNNSMLLEGHRVTMRDLARIYGKPIAFVPATEQVPGNSKEEREVKTWCQKEAEAGRASTGWSHITQKEEGGAGSTNKLWHGHVWQRLEDLQ